MRLLVSLEVLEWMHEGLCRSADPELFFPVKGDAYSAAAAKAICRRCPVVEQCADYAIEARETWGIWGGLNEDDRRALRGLKPHSNSRRAAV